MQTEAEILSFLRDAGWGEAARDPMDADFSSRHFSRLRRAGSKPETAILMQAAADQKTDAFVHLAHLLRRLGVAAPDLYASDIHRGMVLMEDFGQSNCGQMLNGGADRQLFDEAAAGILARIHKNFEQTMLGAFKSSLYNAALFTDQATLFLDFYFPSLFRRMATATERSGFVEAWHGVLAPLDALPRSLLLRDFMPDNAMVLPAPVMGDKLGVIDFQDAGLGPVAYDIGSWCEEVRRDGGLDRLEPFVALYHARYSAVDQATLLRAARIFLAQRHTRILGILVKLEKNEHIPRVWRTVQKLLKDEALTPVRRWFASCTPPSW